MTYLNCKSRLAPRVSSVMLCSLVRTPMHSSGSSLMLTAEPLAAYSLDTICAGLNSNSPKFMSTQNLWMHPFFGNRVFCRCIQVKMRSHWVWVGPKFNMIGALIRRKFKHRDTNIQGEGHLKTGRHWSDASMGQGMPENTRSQKKAKKCSSLDP